jgi:hypothetical protein
VESPPRILPWQIADRRHGLAACEPTRQAAASTRLTSYETQQVAIELVDVSDEKPMPCPIVDFELGARNQLRDSAARGFDVTGTVGSTALIVGDHPYSCAGQVEHLVQALRRGFGGTNTGARARNGSF